ncbi:dTDP-4-dehydrorhamnose 3,5-epimerase family protein [Streptomyces sp. NPDC086023]|uniref:dTDP-4-dehydrorhamnose 3,5-epimerase family protein n=1 Tax=Streptomyces sp. NPDC086023 TaxID=3365746 RepID=UPI0037D59A18
MRFSELSVSGCWEIGPDQHTDVRGAFLEWFRPDLLAEVVGHTMTVAQANVSVSAKGVVRGIHFSVVPPGQAKYVTCVRGAVLDVVVDLRVGSPGFGRWEAVRLDDVDRTALYIPAGLGHGFCALTDDATLCYLSSETYAPHLEHAIDPLDTSLAIDWPTERPVLSERDLAAPSLAAARASGILPDYAACAVREGAASQRRPAGEVGGL